MVAQALYKISNLSRKIANRLSSNDEWRRTLQRWKVDNQQHDLRLHYPELKSTSLIVDLGGYQGQWASDIFAKYLCQVLVFEPYKPFAENIEKRFTYNDKIKTYAFGLAAADDTALIGEAADSTSTYKASEKGIPIQLKSASNFLKENSIDKIDLMKVNIEGGEYDLLDALISAGHIGSIRNLQIQFHDFVPDAHHRMLNIHEALKKTHELTFQYEFLWENWKLKNSGSK